MPPPCPNPRHHLRRRLLRLHPEAKSVSAFFNASGNSMRSISNGKGNSIDRGLSISRSVEKDIVGRTNCSAGVFTYPGNDIESHSRVAEEKIGVILLNLGGPETLQDVQPFLFNLFADPDIIRLPRMFRFLQRPLAQLISVLRAPKSKEGYAAIGGGSPLRKITDEQVRNELEICRRDNKELDVLRKERQYLLAQVQELEGRQPAPIDDSQACTS